MAAGRRMGNNSVVIATDALFLALVLQDKLRDKGYRAFIAATDKDLKDIMKSVYPCLIFIEYCFQGCLTDCLIEKMVNHYRNIHLVVWTASEVKPLVAARFLTAGAESFISLRDSEKNIDVILSRIACGKHCCPAEVEEVLKTDRSIQIIGKELTRREVQIIKLIAPGNTNKDISKLLSLSIQMVKLHKTNIYRKCGGRSVVDILRYGIVRGIIHEEDFLQ
jgi:DNA-binding NarL/FixJ family response regulator